MGGRRDRRFGLEAAQVKGDLGEGLPDPGARAAARAQIRGHRRRFQSEQPSTAGSATTGKVAGWV